MRDARTTRRPANRVVELTVWDVLSLSFDEAPVGQFKEGQLFQVRSNRSNPAHYFWILLNFFSQVTNLLPTQKNAWMDRDVEGAHVYLSTSKTSRWIKPLPARHIVAPIEPGLVRESQKSRYTGGHHLSLLDGPVATRVCAPLSRNPDHHN